MNTYAAKFLYLCLNFTRNVMFFNVQIEPVVDQWFLSFDKFTFIWNAVRFSIRTRHFLMISFIYLKSNTALMFNVNYFLKAKKECNTIENVPTSDSYKKKYYEEERDKSKSLNFSNRVRHTTPIHTRIHLIHIIQLQSVRVGLRKTKQW